MPVLDTHLAWDRVSLLLSTFYARIQGPWTFGDYPVFTARLVVGALGLHTLSIFSQLFMASIWSSCLKSKYLTH